MENARVGSFSVASLYFSIKLLEKQRITFNEKMICLILLFIRVNQL